MNNPRRFKQDAVIIMGILVLILLLWQLHMHSRHYGGLGGWVTTNIFGSATLSVISGEPGDQTNATPVPTNAPVTVVTGGSAQPTHPPPGETPTGGAPPPPLSTNLLRSNGPVTVIDVPAADLVQTPPGVTYASNVAEAATIERRLGEAAAKGGDIQISLSWNNYNDLDLHCVDPKGEEIWFSHTISAQTGGVLDVDRNAQAPYTPTPVENIYCAGPRCAARLVQSICCLLCPAQRHGSQRPHAVYRPSGGQGLEDLLFPLHNQFHWPSGTKTHLHTRLRTRKRRSRPAFPVRAITAFILLRSDTSAPF